MKKNNPRHFILIVITSLLLGSAVARLTPSAGAAIARELNAADASEENSNQPQLNMSDREITQILDAFALRERELDEREAYLANRFKTLTEAEAGLERKLIQITTEEKRLRDTLALATSASEKDLTQLTSVYENMKPKEAAALFEEMEPAFAAGFLAKMRADAAANIMAGLNPRTAYSISAVLAGRHNDAYELTNTD